MSRLFSFSRLALPMLYWHSLAERGLSAISSLTQKCRARASSYETHLSGHRARQASSVDRQIHIEPCGSFGFFQASDGRRNRHRSPPSHPHQCREPILSRRTVHWASTHGLVICSGNRLR
ncbi:hypothetical protein BV20DRAFT_28886 [Pilatotrama ljubarskyi]|nr:hypothetical protein BV20DRAFT_28886 [Pilatotrama ljubarskyi]